MGNQCKGSDEIKEQKSQKGQLTQTMAKKELKLTDFKKHKKLGQGAYGSVYLVSYNDNLYAMKVISRSRIKKESTKQHIEEERKILQNIKSEYIVELKYAFQDSENLYMIVTYVSGGELFFHLREAGTFPIEVCQFYSAQLLMAIFDLHKQNIIYRDLKPENILLDKDGHLKLTDFGLSKKLLKGDRTQSKCGTPEYLAPEVISSSNGYTHEVDFYSLGCVIYEMLIGQPPFYLTDKSRMFQNRLNKELIFPIDFNDDARTLIKELLVPDPQKRLTAEQIKNHPFFSGINFDTLRKVIPPYSFDEQSSKYFEHFMKTKRTIQQDDKIPIGFQFKSFTYIHENN